MSCFVSGTIHSDHLSRHNHTNPWLVYPFLYPFMLAMSTDARVVVMSCDVLTVYLSAQSTWCLLRSTPAE